MARPDRAEGGTKMAIADASFEDVRTALPVSKAAEEFGVTPATVRNWVEKGYIRAIQLPSGQRRIPEFELKRLLGEMFDFGLPVEEEESPHKIRGSMVSTDEDWGPGGP